MSGAAGQYGKLLIIRIIYCRYESRIEGMKAESQEQNKKAAGASLLLLIGMMICKIR